MDPDITVFLGDSITTVALLTSINLAIQTNGRIVFDFEKVEKYFALLIGKIKTSKLTPVEKKKRIRKIELTSEKHTTYNNLKLLHTISGLIGLSILILATFRTLFEYEGKFWLLLSLSLVWYLYLAFFEFVRIIINMIKPEINSFGTHLPIAFSLVMSLLFFVPFAIMYHYPNADILTMGSLNQCKSTCVILLLSVLLIPYLIRVVNGTLWWITYKVFDHRLKLSK